MTASAQPVRVAVVGVGYVGSLHAQIYQQLAGAKLIAVCDVDEARAKETAARLQCRAVTDARELLGEIDAASVAVPTSLHHAVGMKLLQAGIHVLIEKPMATTLADADALLAIAKRKQLILQVGHLERFNAAIRAAKAYLTHPRFIEAHRLSPYPFRPSTPPSASLPGPPRARAGAGRTVPSKVEGRGTDVSVVLDVMIHDLDLVLALVRSQPVRIDALGVSVLSNSEDIANARLAFASGCVANLTASRISDERIRRIRLFQENCYLSIDYQHQAVNLARKSGSAIERTAIPVTPRPPLNDQLADFIRSVRTGRRPIVSGEEAREALALALKIERTMRTSKPRSRK